MMTFRLAERYRQQPTNQHKSHSKEKRCIYEERWRNQGKTQKVGVNKIAAVPSAF